jgi:23S rRNA (cytidine1920-2'-O)/16S rRNA (cytidine1409-2'-O)-methyltransferase
LPSLLKAGGHLLSLVKPQFEVGPEGLGKGGLVKDPGLYSAVEVKVRSLCQSSGMSVKDYFNSPIEGKDGNREFFIFAQKK